MKQDIDLIHNKDHTEDLDDDDSFEAFEEDSYNEDDETVIEEMNFDDPFDNLEDLDNEDDEGDLFK